MTAFDSFLQKQRVRMAARFLAPGARVLDLGCGDGALFRQLTWISGIGIDPTLAHSFDLPNASVMAGRFPDDVPAERGFDAVTLLAVLEHLPVEVQRRLDEACARVLKPEGRVILTVPSAKTDLVLAVLKKFRLVHGMALEEHYGYDVRKTPELFGSFRMVAHERFQLGFNNLFVFEKS